MYEITEADAADHCESRWQLLEGKTSMMDNNKGQLRKLALSNRDAISAEQRKQAAEKLCGTHDFLNFSSLGKTKKSTVSFISRWIFLIYQFLISPQLSVTLAP